MTTLRLYNSLFNGLFDDYDRFYSFRKSPNIMIENRELENSYEYYVPLAGFKKESIKATVQNNGARVIAKQGDKNAMFSFELPKDVDLASLSAKHENGMLTVTAEKKKSAKNIELDIR
tara:strand:- start:12566 stop:12919 length:354 start_codon:yes stop_codon:yes gene_type:complete